MLVSISLSIKLRISAHRMVRLTFRVGLPSSISLVYELPQTHQKLVSMVILNPIPLTIKSDHHKVSVTRIHPFPKRLMSRHLSPQYMSLLGTSHNQARTPAMLWYGKCVVCSHRTLSLQKYMTTCGDLGLLLASTLPGNAWPLEQDATVTVHVPTLPSISNTRHA